MRLHIAPLLSALLIAACAAPEPVPEPVAALPEVKPQPATKPSQPAVAHAAPKPKKPGPIPTRPLNVSTECSFRDETGYNGMMKLTVEQARVQTFEASVTIPRRGNCRFNLRNFRQTRDLPNVELSHLRDRCIVRVWEQGERVTIAFQQCQKMCSGNAWEHLWPILADRRDGSCA
jgi:hypothetical protein